MSDEKTGEAALQAMDARVIAALGAVEHLGVRVQVAKQVRDSGGAPRVAITVDGRDVWRLWWERNEDGIYALHHAWLYAPESLS